MKYKAIVGSRNIDAFNIAVGNILVAIRVTDGIIIGIHYAPVTTFFGLITKEHKLTITWLKNENLW